MLFLLRETYKFIMAKRFLSLFVIISTFLLFLILGTAILITYQAMSYLQQVRENIRIQAFLETDLTKVDSLRISTILSVMAGVDSFYFKSSQEAFEELRSRFRSEEEIFDEIDPSHLPASFVILPRPYWTRSDLLEAIAEKVSVVEGINDVYYGGRWIRALEKLTGIFLMVSVFVIILIFFTFLFISSHAIRITLNDHRDAIYVLKLSGAPSWKLYLPFRLMGIFYGFMASVLTYLVINGVIYMLRSAGYTLFPFPNYLLLAIIPFGILLGYIASENALRDLSPGHV